MKQVFVFLTLVFSLSTWATSPLSDFKVISKTDPQVFGLNQDLIIHETQNDYILKSPLTNFESYDYYYVQLSGAHRNESWFLKNTNVVFNKPGEFVIVEIRNEKQLLEVAAKAHDEGDFCGMLQKLFPEPISLVKASAPMRVGSKNATVQAATDLVEVDNILKTMETMVSWKTRYESNPQGEQTGAQLKALYESIIPAERTDVSIDLVEHSGSPQKSIRVRILGESQPDQLVILGSHIDSINKSNNNDAPGADDNASGTATNLEIFRVLMASGFKPKNTIEIHGYAAEEIGLVGSKEMAQDYKRKGKRVIAMVQIDMNAFTKSGDKITFVSNGTDRSLTSQLQSLSKMYNQIPNTTGFLIFGSSDHASWNSQGFPVAFPTEDPFGFNGNIHTKDDTMDKINSPKQIEEFGKLGVAYLMHFASDF